MVKITNWRGLMRYLMNYKIWLGFLTDLFFYPFALSMLVYTCLTKDRPADTMYAHRDDFPAVLLIHGSGGYEHSWFFTRRKLQDKYSVYSVQLQPPSMNVLTGSDVSIESHAQVVYHRLRNIMRQRGKNGGKVILVGCSMGGLVAGHLAAAFDPECQWIEKVITIGTPWMGAEALNYIDLGTIRHRQMTPGSTFLKCLRNVLITTNHKIHTYGSEYDHFVPFECSFIRGFDKIIKQTPKGHLYPIIANQFDI